MKAAVFEYVRALELEHALHLLAEHGPEAKLVAGGQSLVPMMAMRLAKPAVLVDINRLPALKGVEIGELQVTMGATVRQRDVEDDIELHLALPLIRDALRWVGHIQTRNRGTVGGSLVHADPSAELPLTALVLDATVQLCSRDAGERSLPAHDFFLGPMFTAAGETECLSSISWPVWKGAVSTAFLETSMRHGDFAMASAACQLQFDVDGLCTRAAFGMGGMDGVPRAFPGLAAELRGRRIDAAAAAEIAHEAAARCEPGSDLHADAEYRRHLGAVLLARVLLRAASSARQS